MRLTTLANLALLITYTSGRLFQTPVSHHVRTAKRKLASRRSFVDDLKVAMQQLTSSNKLAKRSEGSGQLVHKRSLSGPGNQCIMKAPTSIGTDGGQTDFPTQTTNAIGGKPTATPTKTSGATTTRRPTSTPTSKGGPQPTQGASPWKILHSSSGQSFFNDFTFWSADDPTHGTVDYLTKEEAEAAGLISINNNDEIIMRVETTPQVTGLRKSVRIHSNYVMNGGLWLLDATHMPIGCGVWPAWWTHGPGWPDLGEIDIIEGVNENEYNQAALHTAPGCMVPGDFGGTGVLAHPADMRSCGVADTANVGCGIRATEQNTYGAGFNRIRGGVYALLWDEDSVSIWFFPRGSIPDDISDEVPNPASWGRPSARWPASTCPPFKYNRDHTTIINTTLCGDWAGGAWAQPGNGGSPSCAAKTGVATCAEWVARNGDSFKEAYWQIRSLKVYQK